MVKPHKLCKIYGTEAEFTLLYVFPIYTQLKQSNLKH